MKRQIVQHHSIAHLLLASRHHYINPVIGQPALQLYYHGRSQHNNLMLNLLIGRRYLLLQNILHNQQAVVQPRAARYGHVYLYYMYLNILLRHPYLRHYPTIFYTPNTYSCSLLLLCTYRHNKIGIPSPTFLLIVQLILVIHVLRLHAIKHSRRTPWPQSKTQHKHQKLLHLLVKEDDLVLHLDEVQVLEGIGSPFC